MKITEKSKIYIVVPANIETGGPEELHQLGAALNDMGFGAYIYYVPINHPSPLCLAYKKYKVPSSKNIEDNQDNILVVPEVFDHLAFSNNFPNIQKLIWWMSVDNFYIYYYLKTRKNINNFVLRAINKLSRLIIKKPVIEFSETAMKIKKDVNLSSEMIIPRVNLHLFQSDYAKHNLLQNGLTNIKHLCGYLDDGFFPYNNAINNKENLVLFNPRKGFKFTKKIISSAPDIKFLPIQNMSRQEVINIMKKAKVYIDFGNHPGKDKMPREAAICGCCVITGKRGSAAFYQDVPLSDKYKFEDEEKNIPQIIDTIKYCTNNYKEAVKEFDEYREIIKKEKNRFIEDIKEIFIKQN